MSAQKGQETAPTTFLEAELRKLGHPNFGKKPPSKPSSSRRLLFDGDSDDSEDQEEDSSMKLNDSVRRLFIEEAPSFDMSLSLDDSNDNNHSTSSTDMNMNLLLSHSNVNTSNSSDDSFNNSSVSTPSVLVSLYRTNGSSNNNSSNNSNGLTQHGNELMLPPQQRNSGFVPTPVKVFPISNLLQAPPSSLSSSDPMASPMRHKRRGLFTDDNSSSNINVQQENSNGDRSRSPSPFGRGRKFMRLLPVTNNNNNSNNNSNNNTKPVLKMQRARSLQDFTPSRSRSSSAPSPRTITKSYTQGQEHFARTTVPVALTLEQFVSTPTQDKHTEWDEEDDLDDLDLEMENEERIQHNRELSFQKSFILDSSAASNSSNNASHASPNSDQGNPNNNNNNSSNPTTALFSTSPFRIPSSVNMSRRKSQPTPPPSFSSELNSVDVSVSASVIDESDMQISVMMDHIPVAMTGLAVEFDGNQTPVSSQSHHSGNLFSSFYADLSTDEEHSAGEEDADVSMTSPDSKRKLKNGMEPAMSPICPVDYGSYELKHHLSYQSQASRITTASCPNSPQPSTQSPTKKQLQRRSMTPQSSVKNRNNVIQYPPEPFSPFDRHKECPPTPQRAPPPHRLVRHSSLSHNKILASYVNVNDTHDHHNDGTDPDLDCVHRFFEEDFTNRVQIGQGSFCDVYRAIWMLDNLPYAIKKSKQSFRGKKHRDAMQQEVKIVHHIGDHPHIVKILRAWQENFRFFIQMELCHYDLYDFVQRMKRKDVSCAFLLRCLQHILKALVVIHAKNIVNMDIKPANVMVYISSFGGISLKLSDFGQALVLDADGTINLDGAEGDAMYMAPELLESNGLVSTKADIFSLGMLLLELSTGDPMPKSGGKWHNLREERTHLYTGNVDPDISALIASMSRANPADRPTAKELLVSVEELMVVHVPEHHTHHTAAATSEPVTTRYARLGAMPHHG